MMPSFTKQFLVIILLFISVNSFSATIKGHVYDKATREQLVGAVVAVKSLNKGTVTELDGSYSLKNIAAGTYSVSISYLGYEAIDTTVALTEDQVVKLDVYLLSTARLMHEVEVKTTAYGGSDEFANRAEQKSISIVNIVSANAIKISPDVTVANVMQRISGVTMDKGSSGEAKYPVIRGMDKKYNTTLVNGVKIPSPNDKDRYVPLDIFPAELLERLEVIKTLMPSMEGDGTGGVVNMVMKSAPTKLMAEASIGAGYSDIFQHRDFMKFDAKTVSMKSPAEKTGDNVAATPSDFPNSNLLISPASTPVNSTGSFTVGNRYLKNKLGVILAGSFQNTLRGVNSNVLVQNATVPPASGPNEPMMQSFSDILVRQYSMRIQRTGVEAKVDYNFNDNNSISLFATYAQMNEYRVRLTTDSLLGGYSLHNYVGIFKITDEIQTMQTRQGIYSLMLQGRNRIVSHLTTDWSLVASQATRKSPDIASFNTYRGVNPDIAAQTISIGPTVVDDESRTWTHNTDKDLAGYLNLHYNQYVLPGLTKIDIGGLYRHKERSNYYNKYSLKSQPDPGLPDQAYVSIPDSKFFFSTNGGYGNGYQNGGTYNFTENIFSYYIQLHEEIGNKVKLDGGARVENTDQSYESSAPVNLIGKYGNFTYTDVLPSIQGKYEINKISAVRLSYFRSVYRPAYADLVPFADPNSNELYQTQGNPDVRHTVIDNYDLRYELFPKGLDQFMIGVFYKSLTDPIEYGLLQTGYSHDETLSPLNAAANAHDAGVELVFRKYVGSFGVALNYTYTSSEVSSLKRRYWANSGGSHYDTIFPKRPLQGQADHIGGISLLYKNTKKRIDAQLGFVYTGERIYTLSVYEGLDNWEKPAVRLDFSAEKQIGKHFTVYFKVNNILNSPYELFIKQHNNAYSGDNRLPFQQSESYVTVQRDLYYRTYLLGLRFKL